MKKVYILFEEVHDLGCCMSCAVIQGVFPTMEIAQEHLARFQEKPRGDHRPDEYWIDEYEVE